MSGSPTVLIADDHPAMLQTASDVLSPHFKVVSAVKDGAAALEMAARANPALIVLDIQMPGLDGFRAARELAERKSPSKIVFLTGQEDDDYISEALSLGARGYVMKRRLHSDLVSALKLALNDQFFISPHAFAGTHKSETGGHVLQFYPDEMTFFRHVSDVTYTALDSGELVFAFLSRKGIIFVGQRLHERGLDYTDAIAAGRYWVFSVEGVLSTVLRDIPPDARCLDALFRACLKRAVARSRDGNRRLTIFSDLMSTLLREGCGYEVAAPIEAVWNELIPEHACTVYCGCPVEQLGGRASRETLSRICCEHCNVIRHDHLAPSSS